MIVSQKKIVGNGHHADPALVGNSVINAALIALQVDNIIIATLTYLAKNLVHIRLLLFDAQITIADGKHNITIGVAQIVIALARQTIISQKSIKLLGIKVHCQHIVAMAQAHSHGQHIFLLWLHLIQISISYIPLASQCGLIPLYLV